MLDLSEIENEVLDARTKGYPGAAAPRRLGALGTSGWNLLAGDLPFPVAVLKREALAHNHAWMRDFCTLTGVGLAPHGKTTMAPQLFAQQLEAGAWGMTFATVHQIGIAVRFGVRRIILANQLLGRAEVATVCALLAAHPELELHVLIDSEAQRAQLEALAAQAGALRPLFALLEVGYDGGRTGCREPGAALALARAIAASPHLRLSGIECYEGGFATGDAEADAVRAAPLLAQVRELAIACASENLFDTDEVILSAGGSALFDLVARELPTRLGRPSRTLLRSGCYLTHDSGLYARMLRAVQTREPTLPRPGLLPALEVWAQVQSCPEPGLAILTLGRRDASYDQELPIPQHWYRPGAAGAPQPLPPGARISALNDQHAYLRLPEGCTLAVGDLVGCGISHPCTTFDRWQLLYLVDDEYTVRGGIRTFF